jgi:hypothetical protein
MYEAKMVEMTEPGKYFVGPPQAEQKKHLKHGQRLSITAQCCQALNTSTKQQRLQSHALQIKL